MIEVANQKIKNENLCDSVNTILMDTEIIGSLIDIKYDGVYSNLNGLNYLKDMNCFVDELLKVIRPGSKVQFTLLNKRCLWEFIYYILKLRPITAFEILIRREKYFVNEMKLFTPGKFKKYFKQYFKVNSPLVLLY